MNSNQSLIYPFVHTPAWEQWQARCRSVAQGLSWPILLLTVGSLSNVVYTCTLPFVCLGVTAGMTLKRRRAIAITISIWVANQWCGYTLHNYPRTLNCFMWGWILLAGTLLVTMLASYQPLFGPGKVSHHYWRMGGFLIGGFILFQLVIGAANLLLGEPSGLTPTILGGIFAGNAGWLISLAIAHGVLVWNSRS
ncbi:MAG: hypothetical protein ACFCU8_20265 [Thermosynechococcaceae cyanobacterium]